MQSFFKSYFTPQEPPPDTSDVSDSEAESEIEVQAETKTVLAGGDELSHYEAPKPWTIRKPVYDKPLPAPKTTPQLGTEDRPEKSASGSAGQAMEGIPELHAPSPQGRRDSRSRSRPFEYDSTLLRSHENIAEFKEVTLEHVMSEKPADDSLVSIEPSVIVISSGRDSSELKAVEEGSNLMLGDVVETASTRAMDMYESRVADRHFPQEVDLSHVRRSVLDMYECQFSGQPFKQELSLDEIMGLSHARHSHVSFAAGSIKSEEGHETKLVSPPPFIPSPLSDEPNPMRLSIESIKEEEETVDMNGNVTKLAILKIKTPEPYEPDETDLAWLYGSQEQDAEFGILPSGLIKVNSEDASTVTHDKKDSEEATSSVGMGKEGDEDSTYVSEASEAVDEESGSRFFTLGDINWKKGIKEKKKIRQLDSMVSVSLEPNQKESPYLHTEMVSATTASLELALAEAGKLVKEEGIPLSPNHLTAEHEVQETGIGPLGIKSIISTPGALDLTTRLTMAGASIGVLLKAAQECRAIDRQRRWEAQPKEDFDRVLRELQFRFPVYEGPPDCGDLFNNVMNELKMTISPYEPEEAQVFAGTKRGSLVDEDGTSLRKRVHQEWEYPLEEIVIQEVTPQVVETKNETIIEKVERVVKEVVQQTTEKAKKKKNKNKKAVVVATEDNQNDKAGESRESVGTRKDLLQASGDRNIIEKTRIVDQGTLDGKQKVDNETVEATVDESGNIILISHTGSDKSSSSRAAKESKDSQKPATTSETDGTSLDKETKQTSAQAEGAGDDQAEKKVIVISSLARSSQNGIEAAGHDSSSLTTHGDNVAGTAIVDGSTTEVQSKSSKKRKKSKKQKAVSFADTSSADKTQSNEAENVEQEQTAGTSSTRSAGKDKTSETDRDTTTESKSSKVSQESTGATGAKAGKTMKSTQESSDAKAADKAVNLASGASGASGSASKATTTSEPRMEQWASARYQEWMNEASTQQNQSQPKKVTSREQTLLAIPVEAPRDAELDDLADSTLAAIDASRTVKGDRDEHGRSYDWPFWSRLVQNIQQNPFSDSVQSLKPSVIEHLVNEKYGGCPPQVRKFLWLYLSDNHVPNNVLPSETKGGSANYIVNDMVSFDVERTYPKGEDYNEKKKHLKDVLQAYAAEDPAVGYCSAVALIGGVLALELDENQSLTLLKRMMFHYGLRRQYIRGLEGTRQRTYQFERLLERFRPELAHHLSEIGSPTETVVGQWLATMFGYRCPFDLVFQVYDLFLMEGYPALFKVALALFSENEKELMAANNKAEVLDFFAHHCYDIHGTDYKRWIEVAGRFDISQEYLEEMCKSFSSISKQSQTLAADQELHGTRSENDMMSAQLRFLTAQMDAMMMDRERFIRENVSLKMQIMDLMEQNYRLGASLYEERAERARDMKVGERELHHLAALYQHRIESLEKKVDRCTCKPKRQE